LEVRKQNITIDIFQTRRYPTLHSIVADWLRVSRR
jgi:hypothetical protein